MIKKMYIIKNENAYINSLDSYNQKAAAYRVW